MIQPGKWYTPPLEHAELYNGKVAPRWVLHVANDHVLFSDGSRKPKECTIKAFEAWCHKYSAEPAQ